MFAACGSGHEAARLHGVFVEEVTALIQILDVCRAGLADGGRHHAGGLRGGEQAFHEQQLAAVVVIERGQDLIVFGEHRIDVILTPARSRLADGNGVRRALRRCPERVAVEAARLRERARRERRAVHHREGRIRRVIVGEVDAGLTERVEVRRIGLSDRVGAQSIPHHDDGARCLRRVRMRRVMSAATE